MEIDAYNSSGNILRDSLTDRLEPRRQLSAIAFHPNRNASLIELSMPAQRTLRVLHVHSGNLFGGIETMLLTLVRQRDDCPAMKTLFALCFSGRLSKELTAAGAEVNWLGEVRVRDPLSVRRARRNLKALLARNRFDVVVTHSCWTQAVFGTTVRSAGTPLVSYLHAPPNSRHWLERLARRTPPDGVLCNSKFTAASADKLYPGIRTDVLYCPVVLGDGLASVTNAKLARAELKTANDAVVIIQVGRLESWKGLATHLQALSLLKDLPNWVFWQVGGAHSTREAEYLKKLEETATGVGIAERVRFLGEHSDVRELLTAADIFCQPNLQAEPFGIVFIEALHAQLPVVSTNIGGVREIVDESCGVLVSPNDPIALSEALRRLISNPATRLSMGKAGPPRAASLCNPRQQMAELERMLSPWQSRERAFL